VYYPLWGGGGRFEASLDMMQPGEGDFQEAGPAGDPIDR
jgi:hypothetical protein